MFQSWPSSSGTVRRAPLSMVVLGGLFEWVTHFEGKDISILD